MLHKIFKIAKYTSVTFLTWLLTVYGATALWGGFESTRDITKATHTNVALVLGTAPYIARGVQNDFFEHRMNAAADVFHAGIVKHLVVSGDSQTREYNETAAMREALESRGVPPASITEDEGGVRTLDSVLRMYNTFGQDEFLVISQGFHLDRALMIAMGQGIHAHGFRADNPDNIQSQARMFVREIFARQKMMYDIIVNTEVNYK